MLSKLDLESKDQGHSKNQNTMPHGPTNMPTTKNMSRDSPSYWCPNDRSNMLWTTYLQSQKGQQKSRVVRLIIITAQRFLASRNQIQLIIAIAKTLNLDQSFDKF